MEIQVNDIQILIDPEDYGRINNAVFLSNGYPAIKTSRTQQIYLHRYLVGARSGQRVYFRNGNRLDIRKSNLVIQ